MEYTIRFAFKRDGEIIAPPRVTYSSHDAPADVRDLYRDAVNAALARCTPLHFSDGMAGAVAGRPIAIRFVDNRTIDDGRRRDHRNNEFEAATRPPLPPARSQSRSCPTIHPRQSEISCLVS
jgi:hypothetical protein